MSDVRFKINGDSPLFVAKVLCNNEVEQVVGNLSIDFAGSTCNSCNIISEGSTNPNFPPLQPSTCYILKVSDSIGNSTCCGFTTPAYVDPPPLVNKSISLLGTEVGTSSQKQINSPKNVYITPRLSQGESVDLTFDIETCNCTNSQNAITLYCSGIPLSPTYMSTNSVISRTINMKYGDDICYDVFSNCVGIGGGCSEGYARLSLSNAVGYGFNALTTIPTSVCTSISFQPAPTSVYIGGFQNLGSGECICGIGKLCTNPPLSPGQSFRVCFSNDSCSLRTVPLGDYMNTQSEFIGAQMGTYGSSCTYLLGDNTGVRDCTGYFSYDVTYNNISEIRLEVKTRSNINNYSLNYINCSNLNLISIDNMSGGSFEILNTQRMWARSSYTCNGNIVPNDCGSSGI